MTIQAIHNHIIFRFVDPVNTRGEFEEATHKSGIIMKGGFDKSAKCPRWATVLTVGAACKHVQVGDKILIPALRWTEGVKYEEQRYWKTDESQLVGVEHDGVFSLLNKFITFLPQKEVISQSSSGLLVISHQSDDTPSGKVLDVASDCEPDLKSSTIYYDDSNFFNFFEQNDKEVGFIKEDDVIVYSPIES